MDEGMLLAAAAGEAAHGMSEGMIRLFSLGYLLLPLVLGAVAGLCLLIAALRRSLSAGAALALGGLSAVVVVGMLFAVRAHGAMTALEAMPHGLPERLVGLLATGYMALPLFLAAVAAIALLVATARKALDGGTALALGGLGGVLVVGTLMGIERHVQAELPPAAPEAGAEVAIDEQRQEIAALEEELRRLSQACDRLLGAQQTMQGQLATAGELGSRLGALAERQAATERQLQAQSEALTATAARLQELQTALLELRSRLEAGTGGGGTSPEGSGGGPAPPR
ncbi:MAG: hypothetical protein KatS3mg102_1388 [Planctomycetota bacterium]|nr:MAG: hypothetical protein KatS3mg102_1388 [Planctomycetota bacterium]